MKKIVFIILLLISNNPSYGQNCSIADLYYKKGDLTRAFDFYEGCAFDGDIKNQYKVATSYYLGKGNEKNFTKALDFYLMSAENGYAPAQVKAALMYWRGEGDEQNLIKALSWLILASDGKENKWFYPAMIDKLKNNNEDNKAKQYAKQIAISLNNKQKNQAINLASQQKFKLLKKKAKEILNTAEYNNFLETIEKNSQDKKKIDAIIMNLQRTYLLRKKNNDDEKNIY